MRRDAGTSDSPSRRAPGRALLGGSFNPPHVGHLRLAIEVREALGGLVDMLDLVPCGNPPHKEPDSLLPFALRAEMTRAAVRGLSGIGVSEEEGSRRGRSYTWDTLSGYRQALPGRELYFVIGMPDFAQIHTWHRGLELPRLCHFVVVARGEQTDAPFREAARRLWPDACSVPPLLPQSSCMALPGGGLAHYLPLPWLAVSASRIRRRWLDGLNVDFLIPRAVDELLRIRHKEVAEHWKSDGMPC
ncbi:MAG TPA: nicotinate (nicotinamide) nucleotide adenylyltransferase [Candidatus Desulfovibrio intestinavium]|uniref:Probable nicotinate-nucleotide adenylyltransferase n=1 Tax=Candidatus Desulfovibrio intestinavium TaxID=2838534 RepID=A0A9D2HM27_9BACT|nr:nicotinate (nicotinamide) nucleotide adenylyltransferase [Candidatus Desulfovibrio intestinavium]